MKVVYASDLHIEINGWNKKDCEPGDILVLAGDTVAAGYLQPHRNDSQARKIKKSLRKFMDQVSPLYQKILMIGGNHESYGMVYDESHLLMKEYLKEWNNVSYLENETFELHGVRFVCATLWTSMKSRDPMVMETCRRGMNDYHYIYEDGLNKKPITPEFTVDKFDKSWAWIQESCKQSNDPTVVVTHHLPSIRGVHPRYRQQHNLLNYAYFSDLDEHIPSNVGAWIHGHTHHSHLEKIENMWLVANQRGYYMEGHAYYDFAIDRWLTVKDDGKIVPEQAGK